MKNINPMRKHYLTKPRKGLMPLSAQCFLYLVVLSLTSAMVGCQLIRPDGLYINQVFIKKDATVEDYCKAKGEHIELVRNNKSVLGIKERK